MCIFCKKVAKRVDRTNQHGTMATSTSHHLYGDSDMTKKLRLTAYLCGDGRYVLCARLLDTDREPWAVGYFPTLAAAEQAARDYRKTFRG